MRRNHARGSGVLSAKRPSNQQINQLGEIEIQNRETKDCFLLAFINNLHSQKWYYSDCLVVLLLEIKCTEV
jgi:hypothetical protein